MSSSSPCVSSFREWPPIALSYTRPNAELFSIHHSLSQPTTSTSPSHCDFISKKALIIYISLQLHCHCPSLHSYYLLSGLLWHPSNQNSSKPCCILRMVFFFLKHELKKKKKTQTWIWYCGSTYLRSVNSFPELL